MVLEDMFAHKLMAMYERIDETGRDIYDAWFFLNSRSPLNKSIVENRSGMAFNMFIQECIHLLENKDDRSLLQGLGELLTPGQKDWAKARLKDETIALLKLRL